MAKKIFVLDSFNNLYDLSENNKCGLSVNKIVNKAALTI